MPVSQDTPLPPSAASSASLGDFGLEAIVVGVTAYVFWLWLDDLRHTRAGTPKPGGFPGATTCSGLAVWLAVSGALTLLMLETAGEYALGVSQQQKDISAFYLLAMIAAAFGEELIFRGFLVVTSRGRAGLLLSILGFSALFALSHEFVWIWKDGGLIFDFSLKAWWSTAMVFAFSLWMYTSRFLPLNPKRSIIPCIAAHLVKNLGVFAIKFAQGHVTGWW